MRKMLVVAALLAAGVDSLAAGPWQPAAGDQVPSRLVALPAPAGEIERKPLSFSWALDPLASLSAPAPFQARSRDYWQSVDARQLREGVALRLSAPGALVRLSPAAGAKAVSRTGMQLRDAANRPARLSSVVGAAELQAAGMDVARGTVVARLGEEARAGDYRLFVPAADRGHYVLHVFEPRSDVILTAQARADRVFAGSPLTVDLRFARGENGLGDARAEAMLVAPDGRSFPATVRRVGQGRMTAQARVPQPASGTTGLWELHVFANAQGIQRDTRTAFAVVQPTARFEAVVGIGARRVSLAIQAASPGRYEARGTLFASGPDRVLRPVAQAHSAAWLDRAHGVLVLDFAQVALPVGYGAPFELRQLELHDQTRMTPLELRTRALRL